MINELIKSDLLEPNPDGDSLGYELYKVLTKIDAGYLNQSIKVKPVSRDQLKDFLSERLKELGYDSATRDMRLSSDRNLRRYALWTALRYWNHYGLELVTAKSSEKEELKLAWVNYCRCLLSFMNFKP